MRQLITVAVVAVCAVLASAPASAQTCLGRPSFSDAPWQARVESGFSSDVRSFGPAVLRGTSSVFGGLTTDLVGYTNLDQTAVSFGGTVGAERAITGISSRLYACPTVTFLHQIGPNVDTADFSANVASFGGRIGILASDGSTLQVIPMIGMDAQWERDTVKTGTDTTSSSRTFTVTRLAVGFVLNKRTAIVPEVIQLFGAAATTTFRVTAAFGFGR